MRGYKTSKDYKRLKELLDKGYEVVCFVPYDCTYEEAEDICKAYLTENGWYVVRARGIQYGTYWDGMKRYKSVEAMFEGIRLEFIEPTEE